MKKRELFFAAFLTIAIFAVVFYFDNLDVRFASGDPPFPGFEEGQLNQCPPKNVYECKEINTKNNPVLLTRSGGGLSEKSTKGLLALLDQYNSLILWMNGAQCNADCTKKQISTFSTKVGLQGVVGSCLNAPSKSGTIEKSANAYTDGQNNRETINTACVRLIALALNSLMTSDFCPTGCSPEIILTDSDFTFVTTPPSNPYGGSRTTYSFSCKIKYTISCTGGTISEQGIAWSEGRVCVGCGPKSGTTPGGSEQDKSTGNANTPGGLGEGQYTSEVSEE